MASTPDHIYVKDCDSRFVWVSASLARSFGCAPEDIISRTDADFFDAERASAYRAVEVEMMRTGTPVLDKVVEHCWPNGHVTYSLNVAMPVRNPAGEVIGVWGTNKDITHQKLTEQALEERTHELESAQGALVSAAREAGMAEIATNVLHNVGNVLNSMVVSTDLIGTRLRESKIKRFVDAMRLMDEHRADLSEFLSTDERGKRLPGYLNKLVATLTAERAFVLEELDSLNKGLDHIRDIVTTQQSYAGASTSVLEPVLIGDLLEDALRMNAGSLARRDVSVVKHWPNVPEALLDKHLILQIVVNLVVNALQAMEAVTDRPHRLTLTAEKIAAAEGALIRVEVEDNGAGISAENLSRLFTYGFTTRKKGHGFGLHSCALAAKAMGATIRAHSDGLGQGARFTFDLPFKEPPTRRSIATA